MKLSIGLKINGLNIFVLILIFINVGAAANNFFEIGDQASEIRAELEALEPEMRKIRDANPEIANNMKTKIDILKERAAEIEETRSQAVVWQILILMFNVVIGTIASFIISRQITLPLKASANLLHHIAQGDLTQPDLKVTTRGEVRVMADALNEMKHDLTGIFSKVLKTALELEASAHEMVTAIHRSANVSKQIASDAEDQAISVHEAADAMDEMENSIRTVTDSTHQALQSANAVNKQAEVGETAVRQTVEAMKQIEESSDKIEAIVAVITDITNQTNLLSLNAAIEAAKAGEMGKGFAVVADEVRRLAERSASATQEIFELIQESTERVNNGTQLVQNTEKALDEIIKNVQETSALIQGIADATATHDEKGQHIVETLKDVDTISKRTADGTNNLSKTSLDLEGTAEDLEKAAESLHHTIEEFKLPDASSSTPATAQQQLTSVSMEDAMSYRDEDKEDIDDDRVTL